jgi:hypothetical protein
MSVLVNGNPDAITGLQNSWNNYELTEFLVSFLASSIPDAIAS